MAGQATLKAGEWVDFLSAIQAKVKDPVSLLKAVFMTIGFKDIVQHFADEKGPEGKWKPRAASTNDFYAMVASGVLNPPKGMPRAAFNPSNKLLQLTGNLRKSILPNNVKKISSNAVEIFANAIYGGQHDRGENGMPKREFMYFSEPAKEKMAEAIASLAFGIK